MKFAIPNYGQYLDQQKVKFVCMKGFVDPTLMVQEAVCMLEDLL